MEEFQSKYSDSNLFFDGIKNMYDTRDYTKDRRNKKLEVSSGKKEPKEKRQFLSEEDKEIVFLIRNRDVANPSIRKIDSDNGYVGRFVR
ncbi:uncharacterized protein Eint_010395 [Encephalitozoon intestinalis ATCC 50506]|uniref:Uncharacterized protein n=1 Tax=Encephalitozoon intestinalis (strain ATCC 50506) TaxID=876142 RepID=W8P8V6_ENCIT|nr:uncharacterized protein Eint_010395 [Encephalitozoon intestinalis ATCC 50506]AHL30068.1 hypothetical protein Eint_010395 [Encephalitozoon intestinalis ATCC 50506]UTX44535.1 hypothetical protein GPK93_01g00440 [Encephalitozoon intestinalis]